ncbi:MAG: polyprenol monophosphomannose synthase [Chloroflexota bacterium]|nr:MAG: polyprenol monophosphomannose synthase [Chloroflexota bacterium]
MPTYNEAKNLPLMIEELLALPLEGYELSVLVVDDNSPDGTGQIADEIARNRSGRVQVMHRAGKQGLGTAYVAGYKRALALDADIVVQMDADFSHSPSYVPGLIKLLSTHDVAVGSRYVSGGGLDERWGLSRRVLSKGGNMYARFITGLGPRDVTAGFKAFRRTSLAALDLDRLKSDGYAFQIEVAYACHKKGLRIAELPITFMDRTYGTSKMSPAIVLEAMWRTWQIKWRY